MFWKRKRSPPEWQPPPERQSPAHVPPGPPAARLQYWFERNGIATAPAPLAEIESLERRYGTRLPEDFRAYLLAAAPADENMDDENTGWWPLARIRSVPEELDEGDPRQDKYLIFADYLAWCYAWAIVCTGDANHGRVSFIGGRDGFVADSFAEFVDLYLAGADSIHGNSRD